MFNQVILSVGRKLSAHLFTTCFFCILILVVLLGGLIQVISSVAFSAYLENTNVQQQQQQQNHQEMAISTAAVTASPFSVFSFNGPSAIDHVYRMARHNNKTGTAFGKVVANAVGKSQSNSIHALVSAMKTDHDDKLSSNGGGGGEARGFTNTKILYKPYMAKSNEQYNQFDKELPNKSPTLSPSSAAASLGSSKSKTINLTVYKSVTPSITDRVIADLKKEEYLSQQRAKQTTIDSDENDDAIYIDGDDDDDDGDGDERNELNSFMRRQNFTADVETSIEKLPSTDVIAATTDDDDDVRVNVKSKPKLNVFAQSIGVRDKKSSKKPTIVTQKYKSFDETTLDIDDDDYVNSGSGDDRITGINNQLNEREMDPDWVPPSIEKIQAKKLNKQERIIKNFAESSYSDGDVMNKEVFDDAEDDIDAIDFVDKDDDQLISQRIAKATAKKVQQKQQKSNAARQTNAAKNGNQQLKPKSKSKPNSRTKQLLTSRQKANNKRKSKEQQYIEEYFSGTKTNSKGDSDSSAGAEAELIKNGWMEPRIRRILGNIRKSEERSQQILLCKGEGELCSMLFKTPIKPVATP